MTAELDRVLTVMAGMGDWVDADDLAQEMEISLPRARHYLRELDREDLVDQQHEQGDGYSLSAKGDAYIVMNELDISVDGTVAEFLDENG